ncbi:DNA methyltransferase [Pasteurellaceae bacterium Orientalotternb1]|nr:DNA methyltransferase [Pasteurellaceae bacterium Orientalotternb1]
MKNFRKAETETLIHYQKFLRKNMTFEEVLLWQEIRKGRLSRFRIRRQAIVAGYIVDFACLPAKLIIEVDGEQHFDPEILKYDENRTLTLNQLGFQVLRFTNSEIKTQLDNVLDEIYFHLNNKT